MPCFEGKLSDGEYKDMSSMDVSASGLTTEAIDSGLPRNGKM
jgi:hypothetical protein